MKDKVLSCESVFWLFSQRGRRTGKEEILWSHTAYQTQDRAHTLGNSVNSSQGNEAFTNLEPRNRLHLPTCSIKDYIYNTSFVQIYA